jgi:hypothetical protein
MMNIADFFFGRFVASIKEEIMRLQKSGVLGHHVFEKRCGWVLNGVLQEHTLRFFALRKLYETAEASGIALHEEYPRGGGQRRIDLVLKEGAEQYAFEFRRWQSEKEEDEILDGDYKKRPQDGGS